MKFVLPLLLLIITGCAFNHAEAAVQKEAITNQAFVAEFYHPGGGEKKPAILLLGGSEGGIPVPDSILTENGYPVLALAYFKRDGLPDTLQMVPLEYFDAPIDWLRKRDATANGTIIAIGASKGAELALLLGSRKKEISGVIAVSPSSVAWDGIPKSFWPPESRSSWSEGGKPIPFVPYDYSQPFNPSDPKAIFKFYEQSLKHTGAVAKATISVEKINGPVLLASGSDDQLWPASFMAEAVCQRLERSKFPHAYQHLKYDGAGHTLNEYFMMGGHKEGNRKARIDLAEKKLKFLQSISKPAVKAARTE